MRHTLLFLALVVLLTACQGIAIQPVDQAPETTEFDENEPEATTVSEPPEEVFRFAVFADSHSDNESMADLLAMAREVDDVAFVLHLGDLTRVGGMDELRLARQTLEESALPYYAVPGDHDIVRAGGAGYFVEIFGARDYHFEFEGWQFLLLDNSDLEREPITEQGRELLEQLSDDQPLVLGMHHPPRHFLLKKNTMEETPSGQSAADALINTLANRTAPTHLMAGEMHTYHEYQLGEIQVTIAGAAGIPSNPFSPQYVLVIVYNDRTLDTQPRQLNHGGNT